MSEQKDKLVHVKGSNGVECVKWLSTIQHRMDLQILGDYVDPEKTVEPKVESKTVEPKTVKPKVTRKKATTTTTTKATEAYKASNTKE